MNEDMKPFSASTMEPRDPHRSLALPPPPFWLTLSWLTEDVNCCLVAAGRVWVAMLAARLVVEEGLGQ